MITSKHADPARVAQAELRHTLATRSKTPKRIVVSGQAAGHDSLRKGPPQPRSPATPTVAGLWIDRRKASIVIISAFGDSLTEVHAGIEHEPSRYNGIQSTTSYESQLVKSDDRHQREFSRHLGRFYERVAAVLGQTRVVFIIGPGEAKGELRKHLEQAGPKGRLIAVGTAAAMSTRQLVACVRAHYQASLDPGHPCSR